MEAMDMEDEASPEAMVVVVAVPLVIEEEVDLEADGAMEEEEDGLVSPLNMPLAMDTDMDADEETNR
jgi:hypothetical protein